jgi:glutamine synthetase
MFSNPDQAISYADENKIVTIDLKLVSLTGRLLHMAIPRSQLTEKTFTDGVGFDGSSVAGFARIEGGDLCMVPQAETGFIDPFFEKPTLSFFCNAVHADSKQPYARDPRTVAQRAETHLRRSKVADRALFAPEFEFYVFSSVTCRQDMFYGGYEIEPAEGQHKSVSAKSPEQGYMLTPPQDELHDLRTEIGEHLERLGVPLRYHHHEGGAAGQCEIEIMLEPLIQVADHAMLIKYVCRNVARRRGKVVTFMPKPLYGAPGNGMHFHQRLEKDGQNLFYDRREKNYANLSDLALQYIGGLLANGRALTGLTNPSTNSFRRLIPGFEAPARLFFSLANRSAAVRIPRYAIAPQDKRIEYRPPDPTCNVYLTMAAMLQAGLAGIQQQIDPAARGFGPYDMDVAKADPAIRKRIVPLPAGLEEALQELDRGREFLLAGEVFGPELIDTWIEWKMRHEVNALRERPTPYEFHLYLDT